MKNITFSLILILIFSFAAVSQETRKFRTQSIAAKFLKEDGTWGEWSDWEDSNSLIVMNGEDQRITLYAEPNRIFDIVSTKEEMDEDGSRILRMMCIGQNQMEIMFRIITDKDFNLQFYIHYNEAVFVYNVKLLTN